MALCSSLMLLSLSCSGLCRQRLPWLGWRWLPSLYFPASISQIKRHSSLLPSSRLKVMPCWSTLGRDILILHASRQVSGCRRDLCLYLTSRIQSSQKTKSELGQAVARAERQCDQQGGVWAARKCRGFAARGETNEWPNVVQGSACCWWESALRPFPTPPQSWGLTLASCSPQESPCQPQSCL